MTVFQRLGVDRAVAYFLFSRLWAIVAAPLTMGLIAKFLSPMQQGFYYTFYSVIALQSFLELGFSLVLTQYASHEWAHLSLRSDGVMTGDPVAISRLASLVSLALRWYACAALLFVLGVGTAGFFFFQRSADVIWIGPWWSLVCLTGLQLFLLPILAILEGCHQVATVNLVRFCGAVAGSCGLWAALGYHQALWAAPMSVGLNLCAQIIPGSILFRVFIRAFRATPIADRIDWRSEIWPMQWRLASNGLVNYFAFSLFNPVMFYYHGPVVAGQMGMTLQVVTALGGTAFAWIQAKVPQFGAFVAKRRYRELDQLFFHVASLSMGVIILGCAGFFGLLYAMYVYQWPIAQRFLPLWPTAAFLVAAIAMQISQCESAYFRAHKQEPIVVMGVVSSLCIGLLVWFFGQRYGPLGAAFAYAGVVCCLLIPWETALWFHYRKVWHDN